MTREAGTVWKSRHKLTLAEVERQAYAVKARPLLTLPESWWDPAVAERMALWIEENVPLRERPAYIYGRRP